MEDYEDFEDFDEELVEEEAEPVDPYDTQHGVSQDAIDKFIERISALAIESAGDIQKLTRDPWRSAITFVANWANLQEKVQEWRPKAEAWEANQKSNKIRLGVFDRIRTETDSESSIAAGVALMQVMQTYISSLQALIEEHGNIILAHHRTLMDKRTGDAAIVLDHMENQYIKKELGVAATELGDRNDLIAERKRLYSQFKSVEGTFDDMFHVAPVESMLDLLKECGLPSYTAVHPLVWLGLAKTSNGRPRADGTRGISPNVKEGPRSERGEARVTKENSNLQFHGILHTYIPNVDTGMWDHMGDPTKQPWEQMLSHDLTISWYNMQEQINRLGKDIKNCTFGMNTLTGQHFIKLLAISVDKEVPLQIKMSDSEFASAKKIYG